MKRYTSRPFPPYRHLPGETPHPERSPEGYLYGVREPAAEPLTEDGFRENEDFLFGVDLFNAGYFWEAHVYWERLWAHEETAPRIQRLLQAIIQTAAACLKARQGRTGGARKLLDRARLESLEPRHVETFGLDIPALARDAREFVEGKGEPPRIVLEEN